jgi:hypothetical protein
MQSTCAPSDPRLPQGAISAVQALTRGLGPAVFSGLFSYFTSSASPVGDFPQAPFYFGGACVVTAMLLALWRLPDTVPAFEDECR